MKKISKKIIAVSLLIWVGINGLIIFSFWYNCRGSYTNSELDVRQNVCASPFLPHFFLNSFVLIVLLTIIALIIAHFYSKNARTSRG